MSEPLIQTVSVLVLESVVVVKSKGKRTIVGKREEEEEREQ